MPTNTASITAQVVPYDGSSSYPYVVSQTPWLPATVQFPSGTAAGQIDSTYQAQLTATTSTSGATIQLNGGGLLTPVGDSFSPVRLDALAVTNVGTNNVFITGALFIGSYTATTALKIPLSPGGMFLHCPGSASTGLSIGSGTNSTLTFTTSTGTSAVQVCAVGRSV